MAKSLFFCLALAAGHVVANAAVHPGEYSDPSHTVDQPIGGIGNAGPPAHHAATQPAFYNPAIHVPPPHGDPLPSTIACNVSAIAANASTPVANASLPVQSAAITSTRPAVGSPVVITEVVTSFTTYCPEATAITVNNVTYSANASAVLTVSSCPGGCRVTRPVSEISNANATVTAIVPSYTTSLAGPTTISLQGAIHTVTKATVLTISSCSGGCTVTTNLQALISSAPPAQYSPNSPVGNGVPNNATIPAAVTASAGTGGAAGTNGFAAGPTGYHANSTAPLQQPKTGGAMGKEFSYATVILAGLVMLF